MNVIYHTYNRDYTVRVSECMPANYEIWNAGKACPAGYVLAAYVERDYNVNMKTLIAIPVTEDERRTLERAWRCGCYNLYRTQDTAYMPHTAGQDISRAAALAALPIFKRITA